MRRLPVSSLALILAMNAGVGVAHAAPADYSFEPITATVERGIAVTLKVALRERAQNRLIPGAEITNAHVDRSPDGQPNESHPAFFEPGLDYGVYRFRADMPTDGNWTLTFVAKVPGEPQPLTANVIFAVTDPVAPTVPARSTSVGPPAR